MDNSKLTSEVIQLVSYQPLWETLARLDVSKTELMKKAEITPSTMARISNHQHVSLTTIEKICQVLNLQIEEVIKRETQSPLLGTFQPNRNEPIHRWYPYLEGYSQQLVNYELRNMLPGDTVYDPFGGSGTTPLTALTNGLNGLYSEINPVMSFIATTKLTAASSAMIGDIDLSHLRDWRAHFAEGTFDASFLDESTSLGDFDRFFDEDALVGIHYLRHCILNEADHLTRDLLRLALASIAVPISLMVRRGDLRFATDKEKQSAVHPFRATLLKKVDDILQDLQSLPKRSPGRHSMTSADVRTSELNECVDVVVTSPPYLNGTNYFRNTKLEMRLLDLIHNETELSSFYQKGITAGINNVSSRREYETLNHPDLIPLVEMLEAEAYDSRIPIMVAGYFADMNTAIEKIRLALRPGGILSFDIGDSQFAGVHVPTHVLLDGLIVNAGFSSLGETVLRTRRSRNGMNLTQRVMRYVKE